MAITRDSATAKVNSGNDYTNTAGDLIVLVAGYEDSGAITGATYGGDALTHAVTKSRTGFNNRHLEIWYRFGSVDTGANATAVTHATAPGFTQYFWSSFASGGSGATADQTGNADAASNQVSIALTLGTGAWTVMGVWSNNGGIAADTNLQVQVIGDFEVYADLDSNGVLSGAQTFIADTTNDNAMGVAFSFVPAGGGGGSRISRLLTLGAG
jgi:hypothetical protein